jgi:1,2-diacylglycerol 3-beta-galactosyltransferase
MVTQGGEACLVSGMILHPRFHETANVDREAERRRFGLDPRLPTGLVLFGGYGSDAMLDVARNAARTTRAVQLIFLCGRNQRLQRKLRAMRLPYPCHVEGFTSDVVEFMRLADFFIGKPGPGSISEALATGLPVIVKHGIKTLAQERYNVQWIVEQQVGVGITRFRELPRAIDQMLEGENFAKMRERVANIRNRAIFEVPEILERILAGVNAAEASPAAVSQSTAGR